MKKEDFSSEYKYWYLPEDLAYSEFKDELKIRGVIRHTKLCPKNHGIVIECSECNVCEKKAEELKGKDGMGELEFLLLKTKMKVK